jgi:hypothetical protein
MIVSLPWKAGDKGVVAPTVSPILLFYSYAPEDASLYTDFETYLKPLHRQVSFWHVGKATAGADVTREVAKWLDEANVIIILVTANYLASDLLCLGEVERAMERHESDEVRVIPVIIGHCDWTTAPFAKLKPLPTGGKPVSAWSDKAEAWTDVARGIRQAIEEFFGSGSGTAPPSNAFQRTR